MLIGLVGDVMLGRTVNDTIGYFGYRYPWGNVLPLLKEHDFTLVNLETTLTNSDEAVPKVFNFKASPDRVKCLQEAHIHAVTLANNHILDFSEPGLIETIDTLKSAGILSVGAGRNAVEAQKPLIFRGEDLTVGVLAYTDNEPTWVAKEEKAGTNYITVGDIERVKKDIENIRSKVDCLIITLHWGPNNRETPSREFQDFAHTLIDLGADIIHGHSAHIIQGIEIYNKKVIFYDTGDFVDDYIADPRLRNDHSFIFRVEVTLAGIQKIKLIPVLISEMQVNLAPCKDYLHMVARMQYLSTHFGTVMFENNKRLQVELGSEDTPQK